MEASVQPLSERQEYPSGQSLSPIPKWLQGGMISLAVFGTLSFVLVTSLWIYLTYRLISWRLKGRQMAKRVANNLPEQPVIPNLDFEEAAFGPRGQSRQAMHGRDFIHAPNTKSQSPNQFLILIYNLFLADMHHAAGFLLNIHWLREDGIFVDHPVCFVQGFFLSIGGLSASCFITFISIHTYMSIVKGRQLPQWVLYLCIILLWVFVYCMSVIPILVTDNGSAVGGFFVRAGPWCWINRGYQEFRLCTHYLFIFISLVTTSCVYVAIFLHLQRQSKIAGAEAMKLTQNATFLIYALVYVMCTLPVAASRIATMAGVQVPALFNCFTGSMAAANGISDCIIFGATRYSIVFGSAYDVGSVATGLETFSFLRTPARNFGHQVMIQGDSSRRHRFSGTVGGWLQSLGKRTSGSARVHTRSISQESLRADNHMAIYMNVVTEITVEGGRQPEHYKRQTSNEASSITSSEDLQ